MIIFSIKAPPGIIEKYKINTEGNLFEKPPTKEHILSQAYEKRGQQVAYKREEENDDEEYKDE